MKLFKNIGKYKFTSGITRVDPFTAKFFDQRKQELFERVNKSRFRHTLGVVEMAQILAETYDIDIQKARLAALLHDWDKGYDDQEMRKRISEVGAKHHTTPEIIENMPTVCHGLTAAFALGQEYPEIPSDVLKAIINHTTADTHMDGLSMIIYCADALEPNRSYPEYDELVGLIGKVSLQDLFIKVYKHSTIAVLQKGKKLHSRTVEIWNYHIDKYNKRH